MLFVFLLPLMLVNKDYHCAMNKFVPGYRDHPKTEKKVVAKRLLPRFYGHKIQGDGQTEPVVSLHFLRVAINRHGQ